MGSPLKEGIVRLEVDIVSRLIIVRNIRNNQKYNKFNKIKESRLDSNIESKSSNNTYLNIIEIFKKL